MNWCFWLSFAALLVTKAADVVSTWRHVGVRGETNPIVRPLFVRFGLGRGMVLVCAVYVVLVVGQYLLVWWFAVPAVVWANSCLGCGVAWVQWDVARFNATGRHSIATRLATRGYARWARWQSGVVSRWQAWGGRR